MDFQQQYLSEPVEISEREKYLRRLAKEYHERTEAYDRTVCSGPIINGGIVPVTAGERLLVNKASVNIRNELTDRARNDIGADHPEVAKYINDHIRRRGF